VAPRGPLVGRRRELDALHAALRSAEAGQGGVALLAGEAGIGKTSIAQAFAAEAARRGAAVLWGRCFEGEWQPPYGPWVEALGDYARQTAPADLHRLLGPAAPLLAQLVPAVRQALPDMPPAAALSSNEERFRLFDAVARLLLSITGERPVLLVLDDLHWADRDSLQLLRYVARSAARARLLLLGAYREDGLDAAGPLVEALAALRREVDDTRIPVRGLGEIETERFLASAAQRDLPQVLVRAIHAETGGNPFYVREIFRHLVEEDKIVARGDRWAIDFSIAELGIPESVRHIIGRRVARLSPPTGELLRLAAAFTGGFDLPVLATLCGCPDDALLNSLDEAIRAGLLRVTGAAPASYDFAHAIVRHTLYDALNPDRRARLHRLIAEALELLHSTGGRGYAAEIAAQYHAAAGLPGAERGLPHALAAAEQARAGYAHDRAAAFLRMARDLAVSLETEVRAEIACKLALAEAEALMLDQARRSTEDAEEALIGAGAGPEASAAFLAEAARALKDGGAPPEAWEPLVARGLALVGARRDLTWARLALLRGRFEPVASGAINAGRWAGFDPQAVAIARRLGEELDYARTLEPAAWRSPSETEEVLALCRTWRNPVAVIRALDVVARDLFHRRGDFRAAGERYGELLAFGERHGSLPGQSEALAHLAGVRLTFGEFVAARQLTQRAWEVIARLGAVHRLQLVKTVMANGMAYFLDGDWPQLAESASQVVAGPATGQGPAGFLVAACAVLNHVRAGDAAGARRLLDMLTPVIAGLEPTIYGQNATVITAGAAVWELEAREYAATFRHLAHALLAAGVGGFVIGSNELTVARMAALLGEAGEAAAFFARARDALEASGQRPLRAIADYDEALALARGGWQERARILGLLDAAEQTFQALGMAGWAQRTADLRAQAPAVRPGGSLPDGITAREAEVLRLLAGGMTNREIAAVLVLSLPTVERHIANIYAKIGARNRAEATAYALRQGLGPG
jgi:DNA-binding CsgD family transcriptional regulator